MTTDLELELMLAERAIHRVACTYARGIDRLDLELVRACYWPDGTDDHGAYSGGVDGFITFVRTALDRFERTNHFLGNCLIDVDLGARVARAETYCVAYHRYADTQGRATDMTAGLRYVDRFEQRDGEWRIARRVCAFDWRRTDIVEGDGGFADTYVRGLRSPDDIVHHILDHILDHIPDPGVVTEHVGADYRGHRFFDCDFTDASLREVRLRGARILGAEMVDVEIDAWIENLRINDVDVVPLIEAELDRRHPERVTLRSTDPDGVREALAFLEDRWADTIEALKNVPEATLHERVDGEWSFVETLRHLVFVNDAWFRRSVLGLTDAFHQLSLAPSFLDAREYVPELADQPTYGEVLIARQHRTSRLRRYLDSVTAAELVRVCSPNQALGYPPTTERPVVECLHVIFGEEWDHHRYVVRDLTRLGVI